MPTEEAAASLMNLPALIRGSRTFLYFVFDLV